ncbi:inner membrane CreD family protein [Pseudoxanthomonas sp. NC8]|nr:inner membrane CreD family protein [Pseudoxanthomonas sp. NC8]
MKSLRLLLRFLTVGGLVLVLLVPLSMIRGLIRDRAHYRGEAVERVSQSMAGPQQLVGPLRVVPRRKSAGSTPPGRTGGSRSGPKRWKATCCRPRNCSRPAVRSPRTCAASACTTCACSSGRRE